MGCDIHLYREKKVNGVWVTADTWVADKYDEDGRMEVPYESRFTDRNYELFGLLSKGVRQEIDYAFMPRGIPFNVSAEIGSEFEMWGGDVHSHSYLYLEELREMAEFLKTKSIRTEGMKDKDGLRALQESIDSGSPDWDLLFPYCKWTNSPNQVEFSIDVPADFHIGGSLKRIIDSFDGVDGDNHRIVFCFDN